VYRQTDIWERVHVRKERWGGGDTLRERYIERQGGREIESPLVMELLSTNDSSFTGFHLLFSIIWKLEWRPGPSFVSQGKMVFVPTAEVSPPTSCMYLK